MSTPSKFDSFIDRLANTPAPADAFNMYAFDNPHNAARRHNLKLYFEQMDLRKPTVLLVGEAPGYQGARLTGLPFVSEHWMINGYPELEMFGSNRGYIKTPEYDKIWKEPSATIVWNTLRRLDFVPLICASYPFHPRVGNDILTNRAPRSDELLIGRPILMELIKLFDINSVAAVGRKAEAQLEAIGVVPSARIRHPANGGATLFAAGIEKLSKQGRHSANASIQ